MTHQVFVSVSKYIIPFSSVATEIQCRIVEYGNKIRETVYHLLPLTQLVRIVKVSNIYYALEVILCCKLADDLVDLIANLLVAFECNHICKATTLWYIEQVSRLACGLIGNVFHEQENENVILVLRGIHPPTKFIAACPERAIEFRFLYCHRVLLPFTETDIRIPKKQISCSSVLQLPQLIFRDQRNHVATHSLLLELH